MECFSSLYATYYDIMYQNKDYQTEIESVIRLIKDNEVGVSEKILSLGAGTLNYEKILIEHGYKIIGLEISADMVNIGTNKIKKNNWKDISLIHGDMRYFKLEDPVEVVLALFNIISYCETEAEFAAVANSAFMNLKSNGVFIFDCWNAGAVKISPPVNRFNKYQIDGGDLYRLTEVSEYLPDENRIDLNIELIEIINSTCRREAELHKLRFWDSANLENILKEAGFSEVRISNFPDIDGQLSLESWPIVVVAKKK